MTSPPIHRVVVDSREGSLADALTAIGYPIVRRQLDIADVQIIMESDEDEGEVVVLAIERKTGLDFVSSVRDGRYHEQKRRLTDAFGRDRIAYVLEGRMTQTRRFVDWDPRTRACLSSLQILHRTPVVCTIDVTDTAAFIVEAVRQLEKKTTRTTNTAVAIPYETIAARASSASCKRANVDPRLCFLKQLCQIPGVSATIATKIADAISVVADEANATPPCMRRLFDYVSKFETPRLALEAIPGVGRKTASNIVEMMGFLYTDEKLSD